jgi:hypothetical protein
MLSQEPTVGAEDKDIAGLMPSIGAKILAVD